MKSTGVKWLWGCGIGCGILIFIAAIIGGAGLFYMRDTIRDVGEVFQGVAEAEESEDELIDRLGAIAEYAPPADGVVSADRVELFLSLREGLREQQSRIESEVSGIRIGELEERDPSFGEVVEILGSLGSLISPTVEYVSIRNRELLDRRMALGEYIYIYSLIYYSWLGHSPEDGPEIGGERIIDGDDSALGSKQIRQRYRRYMLTILRNQLDAIASEQEEWRRTVEGELKGFEANPGRIPWRQGLPPDIEIILQPFRDRCEATYHGTTNCLELPPRDWGNWHFSRD